VSYQMPTLTYETSILSYAASTQPLITADLSVLTYLTALSPSLGEAEQTIEATFYSSPQTAYSIYYAIEYPSLIDDPSAVSSMEESHQSFVSALNYVTSWEAYYTSSASMLSSIESQLTTAFRSYSTLLTAYSYIEDVTSPSEASASVGISSAKTVESDVTYVLSGLTYVLSRLPSLSCYESLIEYYATENPTIASYLWGVYDRTVYVPSSSLTYVATMIASYASLAYADFMIVAGEEYYPSISTLESSFIYAAESDSNLLTEYDTFSYNSYQAYASWSSQVSSYVSS
jgi:hypothetical protein